MQNVKDRMITFWVGGRGLTGHWRPPHRVFLVKYINVLLSTGKIKLLNNIFFFCPLFYRQLLEVLPPNPQVFYLLTPLETSVPRHSETSTSPTPLDARIIAWGSASDFELT